LRTTGLTAVTLLGIITGFTLAVTGATLLWIVTGRT
jgi:hypothetical protein